MDVENSLAAQIAMLKKERDAVVLAHFYTPAEVQDMADFIGDSLQLAQIARRLPNKVIVLCGVHFMGETAKILCPEKTVLVPDPEAGCSLADSCRADEFEAFIKKHPGHIVVSYVNTTARVKALTDVVVTSSNARKVVDSLPADAKIIFGPDRNLGDYINAQTGRNMVVWDGACHVHEQFSLEKLIALKKEHPGAKVLVHPECKKPVQLLADKVGSTKALLDYATQSDATEFIVVTESGILHQMQKECPEKVFIPAPPEDAACACNNCSFMKLNTLEKLRDCLRDMEPQIHVDPAIAAKAVKPIERMLELSK
ncbi:MAG: quinolinate synthase NadA [Muribaculaceae bacterium]|nr:quinolinate synthase NadA [Muribaculaceae bacterium]